MQPFDIILNEVGSDHIQKACGVSEYSIRSAKRGRQFPASWYGEIKKECDRLGLECPMELFSFKRPAQQDDAA